MRKIFSVLMMGAFCLSLGPVWAGGIPGAPKTVYKGSGIISKTDEAQSRVKGRTGYLLNESLPLIFRLPADVMAEFDKAFVGKTSDVVGTKPAGRGAANLVDVDSVRTQEAEKKGTLGLANFPKAGFKRGDYVPKFALTVGKFDCALDTGNNAKLEKETESLIGKEVVVRGELSFFTTPHRETLVVHELQEATQKSRPFIYRK